MRSQSRLVGGGLEFSGTADAQHGAFDFTNISNGPALLGAHFRVGGANGNTGFVTISTGGGTSVVPEASSLAMVGFGALPILGMFIKRRKQSLKM